MHLAAEVSGEPQHDRRHTMQGCNLAPAKPHYNSRISACFEGIAMSRYRERKIRLKSSSPTFDVFPLLLLPMLYFNFMVIAVYGMDAVKVNAWLASSAFEITMFSGAIWSMTQADVIIAAGMGLLFIEVLKSIGSPMLSLVNHGIAVMTLLIYVVQFISFPAFTVSTFFLLGLMQLIDVIAGYTITIVASRGLTR
jgi:hypothetical protein